MIRKLAGLIVSFALTFGLLFATAGVALGGTYGSCDAGDASKFRIWEDTNQGGDSHWYCGNVNGLGIYEPAAPNYCNGAVLFNDTWDYCASSVSVWVPANTRICFYTSGNWSSDFYTIANFTGLNQSYLGINFGSSDNDKMTGAVYRSNTSTC